MDLQRIRHDWATNTLIQYDLILIYMLITFFGATIRDPHHLDNWRGKARVPVGNNQGLMIWLTHSLSVCVTLTNPFCTNLEPKGA